MINGVLNYIKQVWKNKPPPYFLRRTTNLKMRIFLKKKILFSPSAFFYANNPFSVCILFCYIKKSYKFRPFSESFSSIFYVHIPVWILWWCFHLFTRAQRWSSLLLLFSTFDIPILSLFLFSALSQLCFLSRNLDHLSIFSIAQQTNE